MILICSVNKVLGAALNLVRIPCMELSEFANGAAQSGILSLQETTDLFLHFTARNKPTVAYPVKPRQGLRKQICHRLVGSDLDVGGKYIIISTSFSLLQGVGSSRAL